MPPASARYGTFISLSFTAIWPESASDRFVKRTWYSSFWDHENARTTRAMEATITASAIAFFRTGQSLTTSIMFGIPAVLASYDEKVRWTSS